MRFVVLCCIILIMNQSVFGVPDGWDENYFEPSAVVTVTSTLADRLTIELNEEMQIGTKLGKLLYYGNGVPEVHGDYFSLDSNTLEIFINKRMDYDTANSFKVRITQGAFILTFNINLININDNPIQISGGRCTEKENNPEYFTTSCSYNILDLDGLSENLHFEFVPNRFSMSRIAEGIIGERNVTFNLIFSEKEDFETENAIALTWRVWDEQDNDELLIRINIEDVNDEPPMWQTYLFSIQVEEEEEQQIELFAKDGDFALNVPIEYRLNCNDCFCDHLQIIDSTLTIKPIILETSNYNNCKFEIVAIESQDSDWKRFETTQEVFLQIRDINNMKPTITVDNSVIQIVEEYDGKLPVTIRIEDNDNGPNGLYNITLTSSSVMDIDQVLQVVPSIGYQKSNVSIIVKDPSKLTIGGEGILNPFLIIITTNDGIHEDKQSIAVLMLDNKLKKVDQNLN